MAESRAKKGKQQKTVERLPRKNELAAEFLFRTNQVLRVGADIKDHKSFREFFVDIANCVLRAEVDPTFAFNTKTASTLAYLGTVILLGLDRETKKGLDAGLEDQFQKIAADGGMEFTKEEATLIMKQQDRDTAMKLVIKFAMQKQKDETIIDVEPAAETIPVGKRISALTERAANREKKYDRDEFAF